MGLLAAPVILAIYLVVRFVKVNSKDGHFLFILVLGAEGGIFFVSKFSLNFPTDLPRVHIFYLYKHFL